MQSEPYNISSQPHPTVNLEEDSDTSQHGFLPGQLHPGDFRDANESEYIQSTPIFGHGARPTPSLAGDAGVRGRGSRLTEDEEDKSAKPSVQKISDYERALIRPKLERYSDGPEFKIIKKRNNRSDGPQLEAFPNEVLTHILSYLPAPSLSIVSLVSRRFYSLVTTPHAWRIAFSRLFPCQDPLRAPSQPPGESPEEDNEQLRSEQRLFTRLIGLASWRSEYILRTRLLRSLGRGKPAQAVPGRGTSSRLNNAVNNVNAVVTYSSQLFATVNHIHATFESGKKSPRFMHGADETGSACTSDPTSGKVDNWGLADPQALPQFSDLFTGDSPFGEGEGPAGLPNCMDLSQPFGMIYGEGFPGGQAYFRSTEEQRGRFLSQESDLRDLQIGAPKIPALTEAISAVWIAKSDSILTMLGGLIGMMTGSTLGVVTAYSLGSDNTREMRFSKGQLTSKWVVSPGVPVISIQVDTSFSPKREATGRIWAVALNALGEAFYLTEKPSTPTTSVTSDGENLMRSAWVTGRTAYWNLIESSRRVARDDPYHEAQIQGIYSPRSSSKNMGLSLTQITAETAEIETFLKRRPSHFRQACEGWDMRRRLEVDFGGDDGNGAGEAIVIITCGIFEGQPATIKRFTRYKFEQVPCADPFWLQTSIMAPGFPAAVQTLTSTSAGAGIIASHGTSLPGPSQEASKSCQNTPISPVDTASPDRTPSKFRGASTKTPRAFIEEWRLSYLSLGDQRSVEITSSAIDMSTFALTILDEDPLQTANDDAYPLSPFTTPSNQGPGHQNMPGHRARIIAVGTKNGAVILWNLRGPQSTNVTIANEIRPMRIINTDSPQVSCLAISALYLVVGGNDGLVQAWDPLASTIQPIRTLNSRFSSRARRRLIQAEASIQGVGINLYAAGAIILDPNSTVLRGMVSLGTHLRYWSYSSSAADHYQSKKRRFRRCGERGNNGASERFTSTGRGALTDYIATEQEELKKDRLRRSKEYARFRARFGVGLGGLSEEEALTYAEMMSAEAFQKDSMHLMSDAVVQSSDTSEISIAQSVETSSAALTPGHIAKDRAISPRYKTDNELEDDIEEAIRLSLLHGTEEVRRSSRSSASAGYDIPITLKKMKGRPSMSSSPLSTSQSSTNHVRASDSRSKGGVAIDDLDFALQLSLAEELSRRGNSVEELDEHEESFHRLEYPELRAKGKGRAK